MKINVRATLIIFAGLAAAFLLIISLGLGALSVDSAGPAAAGRAGARVGASAPRTLVALNVPIAEFAQDGKRLVWMTGRCKDYEQPVDEIALRSAVGGRAAVLAPSVCGMDTGGWGRPFGDTGLALAGTRALFWWPVEGGNNTYHRIATAAVGKVQRGSGLLVTGPDGSEVTDVDGDGDTLVYGITTAKVANNCNVVGGTCIYEVSGDVWRVEEKRTVRVRGAPVPAALDVSATQIAIAPAQPRWSGRAWPVPAAVNGPVELRDARTGALEKKFAPRGRVVDLALAGDSAAVLVESGSTLRIERYAASSGRLVESARVPSRAQDIDVAGDNVVYRVANAVWLFRGGRTALVARASARPIGLSIEDRQIAWGETLGGHGRIKSVTLSR